MTKTHTIPLDPHIVYCFTINKTFVVVTTDKPRLFTVVIFFYHIFFNNMGEICVFIFNQNIGKCDSLMILLLLIIFFNLIVYCRGFICRLFQETYLFLVHLAHCHHRLFSSEKTHYIKR